MTFWLFSPLPLPLALAAAVSRLPEGQRKALLGAKDFVSLPDGGLNAARRSLAAFG